MNIALWVVQGALAVFYGAAGVLKLFMTNRAQQQLPWAKDSSAGYVKFVGAAELAGALGIVLPLLMGILPWLTPLAAIGLAVIQVLAVAAVHVPRKEYNALPMNAVLLGLAVFAAVGRWAVIV
jgi:uncharacterized membrane protein YphA (DoxX/SURF4 family)